MKAVRVFQNSLEDKKYIACLIYAGIAKYQHSGEELVLINKYIDDIAKSFIGCPIVEGHNQPTGADDPSILGRVERVFCNGEGFKLKDGTEIAADGKYYCEFTIFDERGVEAVERNGFVSTSFCPKEVIEPETGNQYINLDYDIELKSVEARHLALVKNPRYEDATIYENQKENNMEHESKVEIEKGVFVSFFSSTAEKGREILGNIFNNSKVKKNNISDEEAKEKAEDLVKHEEETIAKEKKEEKKDNSKKTMKNSDEEEKKDNEDEEEKKDNEDGDSGKEIKENSVEVDGKSISMEDLKNCWRNNNKDEDTKDNSKEESLYEIETKWFNNSKEEKQYKIGIASIGHNNFFNSNR